jgi:hypothetical protein
MEGDITGIRAPATASGRGAALFTGINVQLDEFPEDDV